MFIPGLQWGGEVFRKPQDRMSWTAWEDWKCFLLLCSVNAKSLLNSCPEITWEVGSQARTWTHISCIPHDKITSEFFSNTVARFLDSPGFWTRQVSLHIPQYLINTHLQIIKPFSFQYASIVDNSTNPCWCQPPAQTVPGLLMKVKDVFLCYELSNHLFSLLTGRIFSEQSLLWIQDPTLQAAK